jgi:hypothetical protein
VKYVLPDIGFEIEAPDGFKLKQGTWYHEPFHTTLHFSYEEGRDFKSVAAEFTPNALQATGKELVASKEVDVSGTSGLLVEISYETKGTRKTGWFVVFPDDAGVCQVGAIIRADQPLAVQESMRNAVLSVRRTKSN